MKDIEDFISEFFLHDGLGVHVVDVFWIDVKYACDFIEGGLVERESVHGLLDDVGEVDF